MNERERFDFDGLVNYLYKNMGDDLVRKLRPGFEYYKQIEAKLEVVSKENEMLKQELEILKRQALQTLNTFQQEETSTLKVSDVNKWIPEPQTPGDGCGVVGNALIRDEDKKETERLPVIRTSFLSKLFGKM